MTAKLGQKVKEAITGFTGIATGRAEYITGCVQILVQPAASILDKSSDFKEPRWFDEDRCEVVDEKILALPRSGPGFDLQAPTK